MIRKVKPAIVNAGTAKAGLLGLLAARLLGVAHRVYVLHGLRLETTTGVKRQLLTMAERLSCRCSHVTLCISESVRRRAIELRLAAPERLRVLADGSWNGVDDSIFGPTERNVRLSDMLRDSLGINRDTPVIGYVGRLTQDKGISELLIAYRMLRLSNPMLRLLLVGEFEKGDSLSREIVRSIGADPGVLVTGWVDDTAPYYQLMTVLALPSRREGFGQVLLEAAAAGVPVIGTAVTGVVDAIVKDVTGILVPVGDASALAEGIHRLIEDRTLAGMLALAAQERAARSFRPERIWAELMDLYRAMLAGSPL